MLKLTYKIFAKMICARLRDCLDAHQSMDQTGFRARTRLEDAFFVFESLCSKCLEWNAPLWFASLDLTKAFDRVEYDPLFTALLEQSVPKAYCALLGGVYTSSNVVLFMAEKHLRYNGESNKEMSPVRFCSMPLWNQR